MSELSESTRAFMAKHPKMYALDRRTVSDLCDEIEALAATVERVRELADEWDALIYKLPPGYPMTVNEFCRYWFKAPLRAALDPEEPRRD